MAARLFRWIPGLIILAIGAAFGWLAEPAFTPDDEFPGDRDAGRDLPLAHADTIGREWLPVPELEQRIHSLSLDDAHRLLEQMPSSFWCSHPNGRDALRIVVHQLRQQYEPADLTRELFRHFRSWDLPASARVETLRNLAEALAAIPDVTFQMVGEALRGSRHDEIRAVAAALVQQRRGASIESDAAALHQFLLAAESSDESVLSLAGELAAAAWFDEQPEAAIAFTIKTTRFFSQVDLRPMLRRLHALDAPAAVAAFKLMAANGNASYWTGESAFLTGLTAAEFREVVSRVPKDERVNAIQGYAIELALQAPGDVLAFVQQFSATELYASWSEQTSHSHEGQLALLPLFAERDPAACREWLASLPTERRVKMLALAGASLQTNPAYARFCLADPDFQLTENTAFPLLRALASEDPAAAFRELSRLPEDKRLEVETSLRAKAILDRCTGDIAATLQGLEEVPENTRGQVRAGVYATLALRYRPQLEQWIAANPESPDAAVFESALAERDGFLSPAGREAILARSLPAIEASPAVASMADSHIRFLAETNPAAATQWFGRIPDGARKTSIAQALVQRWAITDTAAAVAWAEALSPSPARDGALLQLANVQKSEPEEALQLIRQIADPKLRFISAQSLVHEWALADHARAQSMIAELLLSEDQQRKLQSVVDSSPTRIRSTVAQ